MLQGSLTRCRAGSTWYRHVGLGVFLSKAYLIALFLSPFSTYTHKKKWHGGTSSSSGAGADLPVFSGSSISARPTKRWRPLLDSVLMDDFVPKNSPQRRLVESLLWTLHSEGICCPVSWLFPAHLTGRFKQVWFAGLYITLCGTPETKTVTVWYQL